MKISTIALMIFGVLGGTVLAAGAAHASSLPKATQDMIKELKIEGAPFLEGLNEEATSTPAAVVEAAKKEKTLVIGATCRPNEFRRMMAAFKERYPFLEVTCNFGNTFARVVKPLIAFKEGRVDTDLIEGAGGHISAYLDAKALTKIDDLPNFATVLPELRDAGGYYVGVQVQYWCMAYNTKLLTKNDLPNTWDDLVTKAALHDGKIGLGDSANGFMIQLWGANGPDWSKKFMDDLFKVVKPQMRKEGPAAIVGLVAAGEIALAVPTLGYRVSIYANKKARVGFHCPEPVPATYLTAMLINGSPHPNAAKLYLNWRLSKEGQIAAWHSKGTPPVHKDLQLDSFVQYPEQILGRKVAMRSDELMNTEMPILAKIWEEHWKAMAK